MPLTIGHITTKSALNRSKIPSVEWCLNPYVGCTHACLYCYAGCMRSFAEQRGPWGSFVEVKTNLVEVLEKQLVRRKSGTVLLSSATDPYQPIEQKTGLTRRSLLALSNSDLAVSILTKSDLVLRDVDLLRGFAGLFLEPRVEVGLSISTTDRELVELLEPGAVSVDRRLAALEALLSAGIPTWVFVAPLIPGLTDSESSIRALLSELYQRGVRRVMCDSLNFYSQAVARLKSLIERHRPESMGAFLSAERGQREWKTSVRKRFEAVSAALWRQSLRSNW